jgi:hypothetical protein
MGRAMFALIGFNIVTNIAIICIPLAQNVKAKLR